MVGRSTGLLIISLVFLGFIIHLALFSFSFGQVCRFASLGPDCIIRKNLKSVLVYTSLIPLWNCVFTSRVPVYSCRRICIPHSYSEWAGSYLFISFIFILLVASSPCYSPNFGSMHHIYPHIHIYRNLHPRSPLFFLFSFLFLFSVVTGIDSLFGIGRLYR